jgi:hypothetical protein
MAPIRARHLLDLPRVPDALAEASGVRAHVRRDCEPTDPPQAVQRALATSLAECLVAIRKAKPRPPIGAGVSKRGHTSRQTRQVREAWELQVEFDIEPR